MLLPFRLRSQLSTASVIASKVFQVINFELNMLDADHFEKNILESDFENMNIGELHIIYERRNKTRTAIYKAEVKTFFEEFIKGLGPEFQELFSKIIANASQIVIMAIRPHKSYPESGLLPILDEASLSIHSYCSTNDQKRILINGNTITISLLFFLPRNVI